MIVLSRNVSIPDNELEITAIRAQGAGGQHVNKASTAIHLRFDIRASSLPEYYKESLLAASHHLITSEGVMVIKAQEYRSQELNREAAIARLVAVIKELTAVQKSRRATRPTRASKERRLSSKAQKSTVKSLRGKVRHPYCDERDTLFHKESIVKKALLSALAVTSLFALFGCNNRSETQVLQPTQNEELKPMQQSWRGVLPCADCEGIETSLFLQKDGTWVMNQSYQGAKEPSSFATYGTWARTAEKLVLTDTTGDKTYFRAKGEGMEMLDREGNPIESQFNYTLAPVKATLPATPMAMRGMYFYMADAAIFTDCVTGKKVSVANNAQLERDYAVARGNDSKPVLLTVEGHFTLEPNPDSGELVKTLVADKDAKFAAGKDCESK